MITLDKQLEHIVAEQGISVSQLIKDFILDYQSEREAVARAEQSYAEYKRTGQTVSLDQIIKDNNLED